MWLGFYAEKLLGESIFFLESGRNSPILSLKIHHTKKHAYQKRILVRKPCLVGAFFCIAKLEQTIEKKLDESLEKPALEA